MAVSQWSLVFSICHLGLYSEVEFFRNLFKLDLVGLFYIWAWLYNVMGKIHESEIGYIKISLSSLIIFLLHS